MKREIFKIMIKEHEIIESLLNDFKRLQEKDSAEAKRIFQTFVWNIEKHMFLEEKILYNVYSVWNGNIEGMFEILEQHGEIIALIKKIKNNNFFLKDFKYGDRPFVIRGHKGNRFTIKARGIKENEKSIKEKMNILRERLSKGIPNFYDQQRFGKRQNNHFIGREMVKRNFKEAVRKLLTDTNGESPETEKFRKFVSENWGNWKKCLEKSREVKCLDYETDVIYYLTENKDDYLGSLKSIPLGKFFLSSYMSYLFNQALSEIISQGRNVENLEKLGFDAVLSEETRPIYEKILKKGGIKLSDFKIDDEMFLQYGVKPTKFFPENFDFEISGNDLTVKFDLGIGNYATMVLRLIFSDINKLD